MMGDKVRRYIAVLDQMNEFMTSLEKNKDGRYEEKVDEYMDTLDGLWYIMSVREMIEVDSVLEERAKKEVGTR